MAVQPQVFSEISPELGEAIIQELAERFHLKTDSNDGHFAFNDQLIYYYDHRSRRIIIQGLVPGVTVEQIRGLSELES